MCLGQQMDRRMDGWISGRRTDGGNVLDGGGRADGQTDKEVDGQ